MTTPPAPGRGARDPRRGRARIGCLLSDCDGVIVDSEVVADAILTQVLREAFGMRDLAPRLHDLVGRRVIEIIQIVEGQIDRPLTPERRAELQHTIDARVAEAAAPIAGTLQAYTALGLPMAVVSNSALARLRRGVERAGMLALAGPHIYSAEDVGRPKPAPDAYLHAARQLGFPPEACLVIEDSITGVRAASAAGMRVLGFLGGAHVDAGLGARLLDAGAEATFDAMSELPGRVERMNAATS